MHRGTPGCTFTRRGGGQGVLLARGHRAFAGAGARARRDGEIRSRLPFLLKVLAAGKPRSLQVHPSEAQAREGFHTQEVAGIPIDAPERSHRDASAKPELLCALPPWMRSAASETRLRRPAPRGGPARLSTRCSHTGWRRVALTWPLDECMALVAQVRSAAEGLSSRNGFAAEASWVLRLAQLYPEDPGLVAALLLNLIRLHPGEALYLPPGNMHAYLGGSGSRSWRTPTTCCVGADAEAR